MGVTLMMKSLPYHVILLLLLYLNTQCKKSAPPPNVLPLMTQEGKNTFGCKINGEVWIPYYQCGLINFLTKCEELHTDVSKVDSINNLPLDFELSTSREIKTGGTFSSFIIGTTVLKTGKFDSVFTVTYVRDSVSYRPQYPVSNASNAITVTKIDTIKQIISGTFYFTLYGPYGPSNGDSLVVTDGRFDVTYNACLCH